MKVFSWENIIIIVVAMLLGLFVALGARQLNVVERGAEAALLFIILVLLGALTAIVFILKKTLERRDYEVEILREANKARDHFISMLLHFIRTPLTGLRWQLKQFQKEETDEKQKDILKLLYEESVRLGDAVMHLLDVSRASLGQVEYNFQIVPLGKLRSITESATSLAKSATDKKGLTLEVSFEGLASALDVRLDQSKINIVMQTLLENAIQYTKERGRITVKLENKNRDVVFSVSDTGMGIPKEEQDKVFIQFFRAKNARQQVPEGFGVGLFLAKLFIEKHGGKIWFTSWPGKGSTFFFSLPLVTAETEKFLEKIR